MGNKAVRGTLNNGEGDCVNNLIIPAIQALDTAIVVFLNSKSQTEGVKFILDICNPKNKARAQSLETNFYDFVRDEAKKFNLLH